MRCCDDGRIMGMIDSPNQLGLLLVTQLILTLYGAGLRRPFGSLESVKNVPDWLRKYRLPVLLADIAFVAFLLFMWQRLFQTLDLQTFLIAFFAFGAIGSLLARRLDVIKSAAISFIGALLAIYVIVDKSFLG